MISKAVKSHWKLAYRTIKKAIKVTLIDMKQVLIAKKYSFKIADDLERQRYFYQLSEKYGETYSSIIKNYKG